MSISYTEQELDDAYDEFITILRSIAWQVSPLPTREEFRLDYEASLEQQQEDTPVITEEDGDDDADT